MSNPDPQSKTVMVVDDSRVMRQRIRDILVEHGFKVVAEAQDGAEALVKYKEHQPALVTLDIVMPKVHGIDVLKKMLADDPEARVIVVSGLHQKSLLMDALKAGARDFIIKPFSNDELAIAANKCLA